MKQPAEPLEDRWLDESLARPRYAEVTPAHRQERLVVTAYRIGAAVGLVLFLLVLTGGRPTLTSWAPAGGFYDAQADAFLDGRLDIDPERLGIEGFTADGRTYMYQPPWPAVLRLPVAAATDGYDGRLGQSSMLLALLVALSATRRILVSARRAIRADAPATTLERIGAFCLGLLLAGGTVPVFLASRAWVYHESAMWGLAWTLAAFAALLRHRREPSWGALAAVAATTFGAVGSRASVGAGACAAIGLVALVHLWSTRDRPLRVRLAGPAGTLALLAAAGLPALAYVSLNVAKFDSVASIPFEQQTFTRLSPARQAMLEANDGTLFGLQFAPTTLVHYLRLDGVRFSAAFPFVDFPPPGEPIVGDVAFDLVDRTASIPTSLPALVVPAAVGLWTVARRRLADPAGWGAVVAGGLVSCITIVPFGYVAHRYTADAMPVLVVLGAVGLQTAVAAAADRASTTARRTRVMAWIALAILVPLTVWINSGLATVYQRLYVPAPDPDLVAGLVDARLDVGRAPTVLRADRLPPTAQPHEVVVVGDCAGVYIWDGTPIGEFRTDAWIPVERTETAGHIALRAPLADLPTSARHALVVAPGAGPTVAWVERRPDGSVVAGVSGPDVDTVGLPVLPAGREHLDVVLDPFSGEASVTLGNEVLVTGSIVRGTDVSGLVVGSGAGIAGYEATTPIIEIGPDGRRGDDGRLCRRLVG